MTDTKIIETINKEVAYGSTKEETIKILEIQGYAKEDIDTAFTTIEVVKNIKTELPAQAIAVNVPLADVIPDVVNPEVSTLSNVAPVIKNVSIDTPPAVNIPEVPVAIQEHPTTLNLENSVPTIVTPEVPVSIQEHPINLNLENSIPNPNVSIPKVQITPAQTDSVKTPNFTPNQIQTTAIPPFIDPSQNSVPVKSHKGIIFSLIVIFILLIGGVAFAYYKQLGPFSVKQYSEDSFLSGLISKTSSIDTSTFAISVKLNVNPRDKGAIPFAPIDPDEKIRQQYKNDFKRISDVSSIIQLLKSKYGDQQSYDYSTRKYITKKGLPYPSVLSDADMGGSSSYTSYSRESIASTKFGYDPVSNQKYEYRAVDGLKNFNIKVNLESNAAIDSIKKSYYYSATSTIINGNDVTFSKDSGYMYISSELPKPLLVSLSEYMKQISPDISASVLFGATLDVKNPNYPDGSMNVAAEGSFGDLSYKVDVEALKKDKDFYFRINKIPAIISYISNMKGQWIKVSPKATGAATTTDSYSYDPLSSLSESLSKGDAEYRNKRTDFIKTLNNIAQLADKNKLFTFKQSPKKEKVDGRNLIRYDLSIKKESILSFYKEISANGEKYKDIGLVNDTGLVTYLESKEFDDMFNLVKDNVFITVWTDSNGLPAVVEYRMRIVPPDTATQLKDKQIDVIFRITLDNINKPINIKVPSDYKSIETIQEEMKKNDSSSFF
ncbi:MAG: hypothetical protein WCK60_02445 [Candidatus Nomurabacteria bacterium]